MMKTISQTLCPNCGGEGKEIYSALRDKLYGAPGVWQMKHCQNVVCGVYWTDPAPAPADLPLAYQGYYTHQRDDAKANGKRLSRDVRRAFIDRRLGYPLRTSWLSRQISRVAPLMPERSQSWLYCSFYLPWVENGSVLEIGCGSGWQLEALKRAGWKTQGIDFDPAAVAAARSRGLDVQVGDVRDLGLAAASFDAIVMAHVLEHVFDPVGLLIECKRLLKPGGRLVSITPNGRSLGHRIYGPAWRGLEPPRHIVVFTPNGLRHACHRASLHVERLDVTARDAANLLLVSARIRRAGETEQIRRPELGSRPPLFARALAAMERLGIAFGIPFGEELVLTARNGDSAMDLPR